MAAVGTEVTIRDGGMSATVVLPDVTVNHMYKPGIVTTLIATLAQRGTHHLDSDKRFLNSMVEDEQFRHFIVYSTYDVTPYYYQWIGALLTKAPLSDSLVSTESVKTGPIVFEHEITEVGRTSHVWHTFAFDYKTRKLLFKYAFKYVRVNLKTRRPISLPDYANELARKHFADNKQRAMNKYSTIQIQKDSSLISDLPIFFTKNWQVKERNIDSNGHANYIVYVGFMANSLVEAMRLLLHGKPFFVKHVSILYEGESLVGEELTVLVCLKNDDVLTSSGGEFDVIVKVLKYRTRITLCRYVISTVLSSETYVKDCEAKL